MAEKNVSDTIAEGKTHKLELKERTLVNEQGLGLKLLHRGWVQSPLRVPNVTIYKAWPQHSVHPFEASVAE